MAEVWLGQTESGDEAAIKLMRPGLTTGLVRFEAEAAAMARLVHPRIVRILDFGHAVVSDVETPYLVMERAQGPSLEAYLRKGLPPWSRTRNILRCTLEALAHAHSRNLVHRDLKPGNILSFDRHFTDWRLTDFGIAHLQRRNEVEPDEQNPSGTPEYMAPEQFMGRLRNLGPWTDLYALACVAFELVCGRKPFVGESPIELAYRHLKADPPTLEPAVAVPDGLGEWIGVNLRKNPFARFRCAADALRALDRLGEVDETEEYASITTASADAPTVVTPSFEPTLLLGETGDFSWSLDDADEPPVVEVPTPPAKPPQSSLQRYLASVHLATGAGLFGMRELPPVGRHTERERLWSAFVDSVASVGRRTVLLTGDAGIGKSRLARWLCQTADEHGYASTYVLRAAEDRYGVLAPLVARYALAGLSLEEVSARLAARTGAAQWAIDTLAHAVVEGSGADRDIFGALAYVLWNQSEERPVILWIDDIDANSTTMEFFNFVATLPVKSGPVTVVGTLRGASGDVAEVSETTARPDCLVLEIGPFTMRECTLFIRELVGLGSQLAEEIATTAEGNPRFAVEILDGWIREGVLVYDDDGWNLTSATPVLPASLGSRWTDRLAEVLAGRDATAGLALELLAHLGPRCPQADWVEACSLAGFDAPVDLLLDAMRADIVRSEEDEIGFVHEVVRTRVRQDAASGAQLSVALRAAAEVVSGHPDHYDSEQLARLLFGAGRLEEALEPLLEAAESLGRQTSERALQYLDWHQEAIEELRLVDTEAHWRARLTRGNVLRQLGRADESARTHERLAAMARSRGWAKLECDALIGLIEVKSKYQLGHDMVAWGERAIALAAELGDVECEAHAHYLLGDSLGYLGKLHEAMTHYQAAQRLAVDNELPVSEAFALYGIGWLHFLADRPSEATQPLIDSSDLFLEIGRVGQAHAVRAFLGDVYRGIGRLDDAERAYQDGYRFFSRTRRLDAAFILNFALLDLARGRIDACRELIRSAEELERDNDTPRARIGAGIDAFRLLFAIIDGDIPAFDSRMERIEAHRASSGLASVDFVYVAEVASREAIGRLDHARAELITSLTASVLDQLGRREQAEALRNLL